MAELERLKIDSEPRKLRIESEPYARYVHNQYLVLIDVYDMKRKRDYYLIVQSRSLSKPLNDLESSEGQLKGLEIWVNKESDEKLAKYEVSIA